MRDVTAKIRAIELFNPVGLPSATDSLLFPSASIYSVAVGFSARLVAFLSVSPFVPLFSARSMSCSFCHAPVLSPTLFPSLSYALFVIGFSVARFSPFLSRSLTLSLFASSAASGSWALRSFVTPPLFALSHSICHPPSFHHPSKPYSLTGGTRRVAFAGVRERHEAPRW